MRLSYLAYTFSLAMMYFSFVLLVPIIVAFIYNETQAILPFIISGILAIALSSFFRIIIPKNSQLKSINDIKKEVDNLKAMGVKVETNVVVGRTIEIDDNKIIFEAPLLDDNDAVKRYNELIKPDNDAIKKINCEVFDDFFAEYQQ